MSAAIAPPPWIKLSISGFRTGRISAGSLAAKGFWLELLTLAAATGSITAVSANARFLARQTGSTIEETEAALAELVAIGSITITNDEVQLYGADVVQDEIVRWRAANRARKAKFDARAKQQVGEITVPTETSEPGTPTATDLAAVVSKACDSLDGSVGQYLEILGHARDVAAGAEMAGTASPKLAGHLTNTVIAHVVKHCFDERITNKQLPSLFALAGQIGAEHVIWALIETVSVSDLEPGKETRYVLKVARNHAQGMTS